MKQKWWFWGLGVLFIVVAVLELSLGPVPIPFAQIPTGLWQYVHGSRGINPVVLGDIRLPRLFVAALVGAGLAVTGAVLQAIFRNPLADPAIIGVSSGGALGAVAVMEWGTISAFSWLTPLTAFIAGLITMELTYRLSTRNGQTSMYSLILAGVAINAFTSALISMILTLSPLETMQQMLFWLMGGLDGSTWSHVWIIGGVVIVCVALLTFFSSEYDLISMGEEQAHGVGVHLQRVKRLTLLISALMVGVCVSFTGVIGFVRLMVPHVLRMLIGPAHRYLIPASALGGAILLMAADLVARMAFLPLELNVGIVTSAFGAPFFLYLLSKQQQGFTVKMRR